MAFNITLGTLATTSGTTVNAPKPTGLAVGDLMVAHCISFDKTWNLASGWTDPIGNLDSGGTSLSMRIMYRIADAGDVAASTFPFTVTSTGNLGARVIRVTGSVTSSPLSGSRGSSGDTNGSGTASFTGFTPGDANCFYMFFMGSNGFDFTGQSFATDNPSWSEIYDENFNGGQGGLATAVRASTNATGQITFQINRNDFTGYCGAIYAFKPAPSAIKTFNGLAIASVKTVNGLARASVKSINGLE